LEAIDLPKLGGDGTLRADTQFGQNKTEFDEETMEKWGRQ
jgi:hypothetical protein